MFPHQRLFYVLISIIVTLLTGCAAPRHRAEQARIVSEDVARFYTAINIAGPTADADTLASVLRREYVAVGSPGVSSFLGARIGSTDELARVVSDRRAYYNAIRPALIAMASDPTVQSNVRHAFSRLNDWLPGATFPITYLVVGRMNSAGTVGNAGLLIGLEMFGRGPEVPIQSLEHFLRLRSE